MLKPDETKPDEKKPDSDKLQLELPKDDIAAPSQMGEDPCAATVLFSALGANDAHVLAIELEFHFGVRQEPCLLAYFRRNRNLTF